MIFFSIFIRFNSVFFNSCYESLNMQLYLNTNYALGSMDDHVFL